MAPMSLLAALGDVNDIVPSAEAVWRLVVAALLGAVVGFEREVADQPAGLRTHLTVALGAAVFGVISTVGFDEFVTDVSGTNVRVDVTRVASQVVVGIGFLGAGIIFRSGSKVRNLTTAASLWATAAVGLAAGVGDLGIAVTATVALVVALLLVKIPRDAVRARLTKTRLHVAITARRHVDAEEVLAAVHALEGIAVRRVGWGKHDGHTVLHLTIEGHASIHPEGQLAPIVARDDVLSLETDRAVVESHADNG